MPRPRKPTVVRLLQGGRNKQRLNPDEPKPAGKAIAPTWLSPEALLHWNRLAPILERMRVLTEADVDALMLYCRECQVYSDAEKMIRRDGITMETEQGLKKHPAVTVLHEAATHMRNLMASFGMTPSSRASVDKLEERAPGSAWDDFERTG